LVVASDQDNVGAVVPSDLEGVVKQLRATFAFKGFRLVDTLVLRNRDRQGANASGFTKFDADAPSSSTYGVSYRAASIVTDEKGRSVRLDGLKFSARIALKGPPAADTAAAPWLQDTGINTDVDVREGQKVVVGKAAVGNVNTALILVITAKVLE
jgi:hypothetical protein